MNGDVVDIFTRKPVEAEPEVEEEVIHPSQRDPFEDREDDLMDGFRLTEDEETRLRGAVDDMAEAQTPADFLNQVGIIKAIVRKWP